MLLSVLLCTGGPGRAQELKLPNLGESSTSMFSAEFEHQLGRTWHRRPDLLHGRELNDEQRRLLEEFIRETEQAS